MPTITFTEEPTCPFCGKHDAESWTYDVQTKIVEATGLYFAPGKGRVVTGRILTVKHRDGRECSGDPP